MPNTSTMKARHINAGIPATCYVKTVNDAVVRSYDEAVKFLAGERVKLLASNVMVVVTEGTPCCPEAIAIRLYATDILKYYPPTPTTEEFSADNGGFRTPTTITRLNQFGPRGYHFCHSNKVLMCNGVPASHNVRLPVWNVHSLKRLAYRKGLGPDDFAKAGLVDYGVFNNYGEVIDHLIDLGHSRKALAERIKAMPIPEGKLPHVLVSSLRDNKPILHEMERQIVSMTPAEAAERNEDEKVYHHRWVSL